MTYLPHFFTAPSTTIDTRNEDVSTTEEDEVTTEETDKLMSAFAEQMSAAATVKIISAYLHNDSGMLIVSLKCKWNLLKWTSLVRRSYIRFFFGMFYNDLFITLFCFRAFPLNWELHQSAAIEITFFDNIRTF